jgi:molecular chaperone DnaK (HSP70)
MGLQTAEEVRDTYDLEPVGDSYVVPVRGEVATDLNDIIETSTTEKSSEVPEEAAVNPEKKRLTQAELDGMRADLCALIHAEGIDLKEVEKAAGEFSNRWSEKIMQKVENEIIPNMKAEMMGA